MTPHVKSSLASPSLQMDLASVERHQIMTGFFEISSIVIELGDVAMDDVTADLFIF